MSEETWAIVVVGFLATYILGAALDRISKKLDTLVDITHRIRINDRDSF